LHAEKVGIEEWRKKNLINNYFGDQGEGEG
jgi:hypothetical protein